MEESKTSAASKKEAYIYSAASPDAKQKKRFEAFLLKEQGEEFELVWKKDETVGNGFRLEAGGEVYDWTREGRYRQLADMLDEIAARYDDEESDVITLFKSSIDSWEAHVRPEEEGVVLTVGDGIVLAEGQTYRSV